MSSGKKGAVHPKKVFYCAPMCGNHPQKAEGACTDRANQIVMLERFMELVVLDQRNSCRTAPCWFILRSVHFLDAHQIERIPWCLQDDWMKNPEALRQKVRKTDTGNP